MEANWKKSKENVIPSSALTNWQDVANFRERPTEFERHGIRNSFWTSRARVFAESTQCVYAERGHNSAYARDPHWHSRVSSRVCLHVRGDSRQKYLNKKGNSSLGITWDEFLRRSNFPTWSTAFSNIVAPVSRNFRIPKLETSTVMGTSRCIIKPLWSESRLHARENGKKLSLQLITTFP